MKTKDIQSGALLRIESMRDSLKSAEQRLSDYILSHPKDTVHMTIQELEAQSGSSYATIIRFCKKIGYSGFKQLKQSLVQDIIVNNDSPKLSSLLPIEQHDSTGSIIEKTFQHSHKTLDDTQNIIDQAAINRAAEALTGAQEILFIGTGTSGVSAGYAFARFYRIGKKCISENDPTVYKIKASLLTDQDVLFAISSSGRSADIVDAAQIARHAGATVISLCDFAVSPLTKSSNINLYTTPRDTTLFLNIDMPLIIGQITIIDILFSCCCRIAGQYAFDMMHTTKKIADKEKLNK